MKKRTLKVLTASLSFVLAFIMLLVALPIQSAAQEENTTETTAITETPSQGVIPNPDYDPDVDEGSSGTPSLESISGTGAVDPMVIDPPAVVGSRSDQPTIRSTVAFIPLSAIQTKRW